MKSPINEVTGSAGAARFIAAAKAPADARVFGQMFSTFARITVERGLCHYGSWKVDRRTGIAKKER